MHQKRKTSFSQYDTTAEDLEAFLGPLEAKVLDTIWSSDKSPVTVRETYEVLAKENKIAYTTVMSTMNRLYEKGFLDRKVEKGKGGLFYDYWPKMERETFERSAVQEVISSLMKNFGGMATSCLMEEVDIEVLRTELERRDRERKVR